jgi:hypothetical protein
VIGEKLEIQHSIAHTQPGDAAAHMVALPEAQVLRPVASYTASLASADARVESQYVSMLSEQSPRREEKVSE